MHEAFEIMLRPLVACLVLPGILVYYGLHIVRRGVIFVDLALAQVATLGTCVCLLLGHEPDDPHNYFWSLAFTLAGAIIFTFTRQGKSQKLFSLGLGFRPSADNNARCRGRRCQRNAIAGKQAPVERANPHGGHCI